MDLPDLARLILRVSVGGLLGLHGISKLRHGVEAISTQMIGRGLPGSLAHLVFLGEVVGPLLVILGIATRVGGVLMAGNMLVAVWLMHGGDLGHLGRGGGWVLELQALYFVGAVCIALLGSGRYSIMKGRGSWD